MVTLDSSFEGSLEQTILDEAEETIRNDLGPELKRVARENWESYASANDYDIDHVWEDAEGPFVERDSDSIQLRIEYPELTALFCFGVSPHTISGNPLLHFYWAEKDQWVKTESVDWGSETGGIPESRAIRDALAWLRREVSA